jgi:hypothetical protein
MNVPRKDSVRAARHMPVAHGAAILAIMAGSIALPSARAQNLLPTAPSALSFFAGAEARPFSSSSAGAPEDLTTGATLPEAPDPQLAVEPKPKHGTDPAEHIAQKRTKTIPSDWQAQKLSVGWKMRVGAEDLYSVENFGAIFLSAGYEHLLNGEPNYGTDKGAFGERLGAAAVRETTQGIFTDIVFAPLLREDNRYYVKGPRYSPVKRTLYAITRPLVTRKDDGSPTVNAALLLGYAASAAMTPAYYPQSNRNFRDVASVYGGSIGGAALGFFVTEFSQDVLRSLHLHGGQ